MRVAKLYRYPVKGLSPEGLDQVDLTKGQFVPGDRLYAIENGPSGFDPAHPKFLPKIKFVMLMKQGRLAGLQTRYDPASGVLTIGQDESEVARGDLGTPQGRQAIERFLAEFCKGELRGPPKVVAAPAGFRFTDSLDAGFVSFVNQASLRDIERHVGGPIDPVRFRANVTLEGAAAWEEAGWIGKTLAVRELRLRVIKPIERCAAVNVRPGSGARDLDLMKTMLRAYGHLDCGFYAEVAASGSLASGDELTIID
jgi:uncharacterized protein